MAKLTGIDELRRVVRNLDDCFEDFLCRFTLEQLVLIHRAWMQSAWDKCPDGWTMLQVNAALDGYVPQWSPDERPIELREHGPWQDELMYEMQAEEWQEAHSHND